MAATSFDILIIGAGPGGYVAAIRAAQLGFRTAVVEKAYLGGICLNWGCIPTEALLRSAEIYHYLQHATDYGLSADNVSFDPKAVVQRSRGVSKRLNDGVGSLLRKNKVSVIWGQAAIDAPGRFTVTASTTGAPEGALGRGSYQAAHIVLATGARHGRCPVSKATAGWCGPISRRWFPIECRSRCWSWARERQASSSRRSSAPWARR